jgi:CBS domain-containing protein
MTIEDLVRDYVMGTDQTSFPVLHGSELVGVVASRDVRNVPYERWPTATVAELMMPAEQVPAIDAAAGASDALALRYHQSESRKFVTAVEWRPMRGYELLFVVMGTALVSRRPRRTFGEPRGWVWLP